MTTFGEWWEQHNGGVLEEALAALKEGARALLEANGRLQGEVNRLALELSDCRAQLPPPTPPPPPPPPAPAFPFVPDRNRALWAVGLTEAAVRSKLAGLGPDVAAVILTADAVMHAWGQRILDEVQGRDVYLYVRLPTVHYALQTGTWNPFEHATRLLVERDDARLYHTNGQPIVRSQFDGDVNPARVNFNDHADAFGMVWERAQGKARGVVLDGATTNQVYASKPYDADYDRDGRADWTRVGWEAVSTMQRRAGQMVVQALRARYPDCQMIGNGSAEPLHMETTPRTGGNRFEMKGIPPVIQPSDWIGLLDGALIEDLSFPMYVKGDAGAQAPRLSETLYMWGLCARHWRAQGKRFWLGDSMKLFPDVPAPTARTMAHALGLLWGCETVSDTRGWPQTWGDARGDASDLTTANTIDEVARNWRDVTWRRDFERGRLTVRMADWLVQTASLT